MNTSTFSLAAVLLALAMTSACVARPDITPDRTPSWEKYEVLGSRITRRTTTSGQPNSANHVVDVQDTNELAKHPAATVSSRRR